MSPAHLEAMPNELLLAVLCETPSSRELMTILTASPQCYRIFLANRGQVLECTVRRMIVPDNMPLALAAYLRLDDQPEEDLVTMGRDDDTWYRLLKVAHTMNYWIDRFSSAALSKIDSVVAKVARFPRRIRTSKTEAIAKLKEAPSKPLTDIERTRLQRAFLNFERYCRSVMASKAKVRTSPGTRQHCVHAPHFFDNLVQWKRQEVASIFAFVTREMEYVMDQVNSEFNQRLDDILNSSERTLHKSIEMPTCGYRASQEAVSGVASIRDPFKHMTKSQLRMGSRSWRCRQRDQIELLTAMGLPFTRYLCQKAVPKQLELVTRPTMNIMGFGNIFYGSMLRPQGTDCNLETHVDVPGEPNSGQKWVRSFQPKPEAQGGRILRDDDEELSNGGILPTLDISISTLGLMFWDQERLQATGIFGLAWEDIQRCLYAEGRYQDNVCSVEERYQRTNISWEDLLKVKRPKQSEGDEKKLSHVIDY